MSTPELVRYQLLRSMGGRGAAPSEFSTALRGLALDRYSGSYLVGDSEIKLFDPQGQLARRWSTVKPAFSVAIGPENTVWAGESGQIEIFSSAGKPLDVWRREAELGRVTAIAFGASSFVYAADASARAIRRYDVKSGKLLNTIGTNNPTHGFLVPNGMLDFDVDGAGVVYAANPGKHRVERYAGDGTLLGKLGKFTGPDPAGFSGCCNPTNVAVAGNSGVFVTEKAAPKAKLYGFEGQWKGVIEGDGFFDPMSRNMDLAVNAAGQVFVADTARCRVLVFQ